MKKRDPNAEAYAKFLVTYREMKAALDELLEKAAATQDLPTRIGLLERAADLLEGTARGFMDLPRPVRRRADAQEAGKRLADLAMSVDRTIAEARAMLARPSVLH